MAARQTTQPSAIEWPRSPQQRWPLLLGLALLLGTSGWSSPSLAAPRAATKRTARATSKARAPRGLAALRRPYDRAKKPLGDKAIYRAPASKDDHWEVAAADLLDRTQYTDLRNATVELLKRYPPDKHYFIGLGRDPTPIIAFLKNIGGKRLAINFPGSSNYADPTHSNFKRYGDKFMPHKNVIGDRKVVIVDMTSSGRALKQYAPYFKHYLTERNPKTQVTTVGYSYNSVIGADDVISTDNFKDVDEYFTGAYENAVAEFDRHPITSLSTPPTRTNKQFTAFSTAVMQRMQRDVVLDKFLSKLGVRPGTASDATAAGPSKRGKPTKAAKPLNPWLPKFATRPLKQRKGSATGKAPLLTLKENGQQHSYLSKAAYQQLRKGALGILNQAKLSPEKCFYVGVGRSSTAMVAFMENLGQGIASYLPADGVHRYAKRGEETGRSLSSARKKAFFEIFDKFLPKKLLKGQRTVVLFQQTSSGKSLPLVQTLLKEYFEARQVNVEVKTLALGTSGISGATFAADIFKAADLAQLNDHKYSLVSPYGYFRPGSSKVDAKSDVLGKDRSPKRRRANYGKFKGALLRRMQADPQVGKALARLEKRAAKLAAR